MLPTKMPSTPTPWVIFFPLAWAILLSRKRSFRADARTSLKALQKPLQITGAENIPQTGPGLVIINHFSHASFHSWWLTLAPSSAIPVEVHWIITSAWVFQDPIKFRTITLASRWVFKRIAHVYGFFQMPPMPPNPAETLERARTVREILRYVKHHPNALIGISPEGRDTAGGALSKTFPGAGRFLLQLAGHGLPFYPVGIFLQEDRLCLSFGPPYKLAVPDGLPPEQRDGYASCLVMESIARLLPADLRGAYPVS